MTRDQQPFSEPIRPLVSVIIACRNEVEFICKCLDSIIESTYPQHCLEIIVVDGMSIDGTRDLVQGYTDRYRQIVMIDNPQQTTPVAFNKGIAASRGEVIVRLDAHAEYPDTYIEKGVICLDSRGVDVVGGPIVTLPGADTFVAHAISILLSTKFGVGNSPFRTGQAERFVKTVPFGVYRRSAIERVGGFDERLTRNQDNDLNARIANSGGRLLITPDLSAYYRSRPTLWGLAQYGFRTGYWNVASMGLGGSGMRPYHFVPLCFVFSLMVLSFLAPWSLIARIGLSVISGAYFAAALGNAIVSAVRHGFRFIMVLPMIAFIYHVSYGTGSLVRLLRSGRFWSGTGIRAGTPPIS